MTESVAEKLLDIYKKVLDIEIDENEFFKGNLMKNLNIDSLIALQLIVEIEKNFHIVIEDDELAIKLLDSPSFFIDYSMQNILNVNSNQEDRKHDDW